MVSMMVKLQDDADLKFDDEIMLEPIPHGDVKQLIAGYLTSDTIAAIGLVINYYSLSSNRFVKSQVP